MDYHAISFSWYDLMFLQGHVADEIPNTEEISEFLNNQMSVEKQLQEQVKFYQVYKSTCLRQ